METVALHMQARIRQLIADLTEIEHKRMKAWDELEYYLKDARAQPIVFTYPRLDKFSKEEWDKHAEVLGVKFIDAPDAD